MSNATKSTNFVAYRHLISPTKTECLLNRNYIILIPLQFIINHPYNEKDFYTHGGVVALCWPHDTTAAPLAPKTLGELLGIRETPAQTFASGAPAATTGTRHQGQLALKCGVLKNIDGSEGLRL